MIKNLDKIKIEETYIEKLFYCFLDCTNKTNQLQGRCIFCNNFTVHEYWLKPNTTQVAYGPVSGLVFNKQLITTKQTLTDVTVQKVKKVRTSKIISR